MKSLIYLSKLKAFGYIRRLFKKPTTAILTILGVIFFVALFFMMSMAYSGMEDKLPFSFFSIIYLGFALFMGVIFLFQPRTALFTSTDANFLLVGPYDNKKVMAYALSGSLTSTVLFTFLTMAYSVCFFGGLFDISVLDIIWMVFVSILLFFSFFGLIDMVYLRFMTSKHKNIIRIGIFLLMIVIVLSVYAFYVSTHYSGDLMATSLMFISSDYFSYTPIIGWAYMALSSMHDLDVLKALLGIFFLGLVDLLLVLMTITTKDIDPEIIVNDAEWYEKMRERQRKGGSNLNLNLKVKAVKGVKFNRGADAVSSRMMLDMRKTNSFITKQELLLIALYFAIAFFSDYGFTWYSRYVSIVLFVITLSANYTDELKHHYIYLIPDSPIKKLIAILKPTIIKVGLVVLVMNTVGIIFGTNVLEYIAALFETFGYGLIFITANIWCTRLLKANTNEVANQFIKMGIIILCLLPGILLGLLFGFLLNPLAYSYVSALTSIIMSSILIYFSKGVVSGVEYSAD